MTNHKIAKIKRKNNYVIYIKKMQLKLKIQALKKIIIIITIFLLVKVNKLVALNFYSKHVIMQIHKINNIYHI
jgi:hypothetical protein